MYKCCKPAVFHFFLESIRILKEPGIFFRVLSSDVCYIWSHVFSFRHLSPCTVACVYRLSGESHCWHCPVSTPFAKHAGNNTALYWSKMAWEWVSGEFVCIHSSSFYFECFSAAILKMKVNTFWTKQEKSQNTIQFKTDVNEAVLVQ